MVTASGRASGVRGLQKQHRKSVTGTDRQSMQKMHMRMHVAVMRKRPCVGGRKQAYVHAEVHDQSKHACGRAR